MYLCISTVLKASKLFAGFFILYLFMLNSASWAQEENTVNDDINSMLTEANSKALAKERTWHRLLFYRNTPEVLNSQFYLTPTKHFTPYAELVATLHAVIADPTISCRFPARLLWLDQQLISFTTPQVNCPDLPVIQPYPKFILVSGYIANPASSFGHGMVRFGSDTLDQRLLSNAVNFGAKVPPHTNSVLYVANGLTGGYTANFDTSKYFQQDAVYSQTEQRDIWEFSLHLSTYENTLLQYHLYEAQKQPMQYYFVKQNCAYRLAELVELIKPNLHITNRIGPWYTPNYVFDKLLAYHDTSPLVSDLSYIPSSQKIVYTQFAALDNTLQTLANDYIRKATPQSLTAINKVAVLKDKQALLDFLIGYYRYKFASSGDIQYEQHKKQLIITRLQLPVLPIATEVAKVAQPTPPTSDLANSTVGLGLGTSHNTVTLAVYEQSILQPSANLENQFSALRTRLDYDQSAHNWQLAQFDIIAIKKLHPLNIPLYGERRPSWELSTGLAATPLSNAPANGYLQGGVGGAYKLGNNLNSYALLKAGLYNNGKTAVLNPEVGVVLQHKNWGLRLQHSYWYQKASPRYSQYTVNLLVGINHNNAVTLNADKDNTTLGWQWHW